MDSKEISKELGVRYVLEGSVQRDQNPAPRTEEIILARANEIDSQNKLWTVPAEHMKLKREHAVPLCDRAMKLLEHAGNSYLFPSPSHPDKHLSNMAMLKVLERIGYGNVTVHGFRSTFKHWCRDRTRFENYVSEAALAHASGDKIEAAYARSDVINKRRRLMKEWGDYCASKPTPTRNVLNMRSA